MTTEAQREWQERVETLRNDARLRQQQQGTTLSQFAQAEANEVGGRFSGHEKATVVGTQPCSPDYPAAPNWAFDPSGVEPPLGYSVSDPPPPVGEAHEIERSLHELGETGAACGPPDGGADVAPASSPPFSDVVESAAPSTSNTDNPDDDPPEAA